ncbi:MAG: 30S ribosomal protein S6--L-glutamate ligase [Pseudomonadota bacterium]
MQNLNFGWEEWIALPDLGLPAVRAKVDTGARTSALHAVEIEPFGRSTNPKVRFLVHPIPENMDLMIPCSAKVLDQREVTSSNGESELRYVIETDLKVGDATWPIELTLTNRLGMSVHMLLGRQALHEGVQVNATERFCQPVLDYDIYKSVKSYRAAAVQRPLRIGIMTREDNFTTRRMIAEGEARGHTVEPIDTARCYMLINTKAPEVHYDGQRLPHYDAIIPRIGASMTAYGTAVLRQFETIGTYCVNGSSGITASRDKLHAHQLMARHKIGMPNTAFANSPKDTRSLISLVGTAPVILKLMESTQGRGVVLAETSKAAESVISAFRGLKANFLVQDFVKEANGEDIRCLVIAGKVVAAMKRKAAAGDFRSNLHQGGSSEKVRITKTEREVALQAAKAFDLGVAGVDILRSDDGPKVLEVNSSPGFEGIETVSDKNLVGLVFDHIETVVQRTKLTTRRVLKK